MKSVYQVSLRIVVLMLLLLPNFVFAQNLNLSKSNLRMMSVAEMKELCITDISALNDSIRFSVSNRKYGYDIITKLPVLFVDISSYFADIEDKNLIKVRYDSIVAEYERCDSIVDYYSFVFQQREKSNALIKATHKKLQKDVWDKTEMVWEMYYEPEKCVLQLDTLHGDDLFEFDSIRNELLVQLTHRYEDALNVISLGRERQWRTKKIKEIAEEKNKELRMRAKTMCNVPKFARIECVDLLPSNANELDSIKSFMERQCELIMTEYQQRMTELNQYAQKEDEDRVNEIIEHYGEALAKVDLKKDEFLREVILQYEQFEHIVSMYDYIVDNNKKLARQYASDLANYADKKEFCITKVRELQLEINK